MIGDLTKRTCQIQLIEGDGNEPAPALKLLGSTHMGRDPEQVLFEETIGMLDAEPQSIAGGDLLEGNVLIEGDKPTAAGIAFGPFGTLTLHLNDVDRERGILFEVQVAEAAEADGPPFTVLLRALGLWLPMGLLVFPLEEGPVLRSRSMLVDADSPRTVELAIAFETN